MAESGAAAAEPANTAPIAEWFQAHSAELGPIAAILLIQFIFVLIAINGSDVLGVSLAGSTTVFMAELMLTFFALFLLYGPALTNRQRALRSRTSILEGGSYEWFLLWYGAFMFVMIAVTGLFAHYLGGPAFTASGGTVIQDVVFYGAFVGPTETLLFVIALPAVLPARLWWLGAGVIFAIFHLPVDTATYGVGDASALLYGFAFRFAFGCGIYLLYAGTRRFGFAGAGPGAAMSVHTMYDLWVAGALLPVPLSLFHLSGVFGA